MRTAPGQWPTHAWPGFPKYSLSYWGTEAYTASQDDLIAWCLRRPDKMTKRQISTLLRLELLGICTLQDAQAVALIVASIEQRGCFMQIMDKDIDQNAECRHYDEMAARHFSRVARKAAGQEPVGLITFISLASAPPHIRDALAYLELI